MIKRSVVGMLAVLLLVAVMGCAAAPERLPGLEEQGAAPVPRGTQVVEAPVEKEVEVDDSAGRPAEYADVERLIIRNANLDIVVRDTEEAVESISDLALDMDGYVVESNLSQYQEGKQAYLRLKVPADRLDQALDSIRDVAVEVRRENVSGQDVTDEYVDLRSRMRHLEATEERLLTFMEEAEDTEAALEVYDRLQDIQAQIEQTKGRMEYLEQSAAMATITLNITPSRLAQPIEVGGWQPQGTLRDAFESLIRVLQFMVDALIVVVVLIIPILIAVSLPFLGVFLLIRAWVRRRRAGKAHQEQDETETG